MQTLKQFVDAWIGKQLWFNGYDQCVAVAEVYGRDVLGYPPVWANAIDWFGKGALSLRWTANTPTNMPDEGDVITWHANYKVGTGVYGHIAIVLGPSTGQPAPTAMEFYSFDQNWGTGALALCRVVKHTYDGVTGWADSITVPDAGALAAAVVVQAAIDAKVAADAAAAKAVLDKVVADAAAMKAAQAVADAKTAADAKAAADAQAIVDAVATTAAIEAAAKIEAAKLAAKAKANADAALAKQKTPNRQGGIVGVLLVILAAIVGKIINR